MLKSNNHKMSHYCQYCSKSYKSATSYKNHLAFCEFQYKSIHSTYDSNYSPNIHLMFDFMQHMMVKIQSLEEDNAILKRHLSNKMKKVNVIQWLNNNIKTELSLNDWVKSISLRKYVGKIFEHDIPSAMCNLFDDNIHQCPLKTVINKKSQFYLYDNGQWKVYDFDSIHKLIRNIYMKLIECFLNDPEYIQLCNSDNDKQQDEYLFKYNRILGPSNEQWIKQVRKYWFEKSVIDINQ